MPRRKPIIWISAETAGTVAQNGGTGTVTVDFTNYTRPDKRYRLAQVRCGKVASNSASRITAVLAGGTALPLPVDIAFGGDFGSAEVDQELCPWTARTLTANVTNNSAGLAIIAVSFGVQELDDGP